MMDRISNLLSAMCRIASGVSVVSMALIAFMDSIGRPLGHPVPGASEYVSFALMLFFFSSLPLVVRDNAQIRVGLLSDFYSARMSRIELAITSVIETCGIVALTWMVFDQASRLFRFGTQSVYFELPIAYFVFVAFVFSLIAVWFALVNALHSHAHDRVCAAEDAEKEGK